jgi:coiled-coil domain-containing protein 63/114
LNRNLKTKDRGPERPLETQELMRRRIQRYILGNKEKVQVMEKYQKNMKVIDEAFNIVKETSGITDPEEIATTVIKSEEQNYSLFNYVNILTQEIDFLEENNKDLEEEIQSLTVHNDLAFNSYRANTSRD